MKFDKNVMAVLAYRLIQIGSVGITSLLIPYFVDKVEVGVYFVVLNLIAAQLIFELGLNQGLLQVGSHIKNQDTNAFHSLLKWLEENYVLIAKKFLTFSIVAGGAYFYYFTPEKYGYIIYHWVIISVAASIMLAISYKYTLIESEGRVADSAIGKIIPLIISTCVIWIFLYYKFGFFSIVIGYVVQSLVMLCWLSRNFRKNKEDTKNSHLQDDEYINEICGIKNKYALSYFSGYASYNTVVPLVYALISPSEAGRVGFTLAVFSSATLLSTSIISAKNQMLANLIANKDYASLNKIYIKYTAYVIATSIILVALVFLIFDLFNGFGIDIKSKLISYKYILFVASASIANTLIYSFAIYVRSHKIEPFVKTSVFTAISTVTFVAIGAQFSADWSVVGYASSILIIALPLTSRIFFGKYKINKEKC